MKEMTLQEYLANGTQSGLAKALGIRQSAVSQMLAAGRDIRVLVSDAGEVSKAFEVKPLGRTRKQQFRAA